MNQILFASNVAAVVVFVLIFYRLVARCNAILRARAFARDMIKQVEAKVQWFFELKSIHELSDKRFLERLEANTRSPDSSLELDFEGLLYDMTQFWKKGEVGPANRTFGRWRMQVNGGMPDHRRFGKTAENYGMFFTVLGGLLAFWMIGNSADDPFAMFKPLALGLATTLCGQICNITIRHFLDFFGRSESALMTKAEALLDQIELRVLASVKQSSTPEVVAKDSPSSKTQAHTQKSTKPNRSKAKAPKPLSSGSLPNKPGTGYEEPRNGNLTQSRPKMADVNDPLSSETATERRGFATVSGQERVLTNGKAKACPAFSRQSLEDEAIGGCQGIKSTMRNAEDAEVKSDGTLDSRTSFDRPPLLYDPVDSVCFEDSLEEEIEEMLKDGSESQQGLNRVDSPTGPKTPPDCNELPTSDNDHESATEFEQGSQSGWGWGAHHLFAAGKNWRPSETCFNASTPQPVIEVFSTTTKNGKPDIDNRNGGEVNHG